MNYYDPPMIQTYSGININPFSMTMAEIKIEDIAHSLSMICRFNGHCKQFFSVAQHSVLVARKMSPDYRMYGLLHDASEFALLDIPTPIKVRWEFDFYRDSEAFLQGLIYNKFGLPAAEPDELHTIDRRMVLTEARDLYHPLTCYPNLEPYEETIVPLSQQEAKALFLNAFQKIEAAEDI